MYKNITKIILTSVIVVLTTGIASAQGQTGRILKGRIIDENGAPIAGAVINVSESSTIALSDADGYFSLKNVKADE